MMVIFLCQWDMGVKVSQASDWLKSRVTLPSNVAYNLTQRTFLCNINKTRMLLCHLIERIFNVRLESSVAPNNM